jgi:hypothetical protein
MALYLAGYAGACLALMYFRRRLSEIERADLSYLGPVMAIGALAPLVFFARRYVPDYQTQIAAVASSLVFASVLVPTVSLVARVTRKVDKLEEELEAVSAKVYSPPDAIRPRRAAL